MFALKTRQGRRGQCGAGGGSSLEGLGGDMGRAALAGLLGEGSMGAQRASDRRAALPEATSPHLTTATCPGRLAACCGFSP